jgi:hypothetical protein
MVRNGLQSTYNRARENSDGLTMKEVYECENAYLLIGVGCRVAHDKTRRIGWTSPGCLGRSCNLAARSYNSRYIVSNERSECSIMLKT